MIKEDFSVFGNALKLLHFLIYAIPIGLIGLGIWILTLIF